MDWAVPIHRVFATSRLPFFVHLETIPRKFTFLEHYQKTRRAALQKTSPPPTCTSKLCCCCCCNTALSTWCCWDGGGAYWCGCWSYGAGGGCSAKCSNCWFTDSASVTPKWGARWGGMWCRWGGSCSWGFSTTTPVSNVRPFFVRSSSAGDGCLLPGVRLK